MSAVDGMPVGIKDLIETYDMPTEFGSELFRGHQPMTDAACVRALRRGGAVLVGKTVTVCFGGGDPARTRNPFDTRRTPGGSSSGTAAAVASRMLPVALGTHARGSTIRPASFCGTYALKPTFGAINRQGSFSMAYSMDHLGVFAGTLSDMWTTARFIVERRRRRSGLSGPRRRAQPAAAAQAGAPHPPRHRRLAGRGACRQGGVRGLSARGSRTPALRSSPGVMIRRSRLMKLRWPACRSSGPISTASRCTGRCCSTASATADKLPPRLLKGIEDGAHITQETYRAALIEREQLRAMHDELAQRADGFITLSSPGPAPIGMDQGSAIFNEASSVLGAPAINLPLLAVDAAPLGVQLLGRWQGDERLTAVGALARRGPFRQRRLTGVLPPRPCWRGAEIAVTIFESRLSPQEMSMRFVLAVFALLLASLSFDSRDAVASPEGKRVALLGTSNANPYIGAWTSTFIKFATDAGMKVTNLNSNYDAAVQSQQIDDAIAQKFDIIVHGLRQRSGRRAGVDPRQGGRHSGRARRHAVEEGLRGAVHVLCRHRPQRARAPGRRRHGQGADGRRQDQGADRRGDRRRPAAQRPGPHGGFQGRAGQASRL